MSLRLTRKTRMMKRTVAEQGVVEDAAGGTAADRERRRGSLNLEKVKCVRRNIQTDRMRCLKELEAKRDRSSVH